MKVRRVCSLLATNTFLREVEGRRRVARLNAREKKGYRITRIPKKLLSLKMYHDYSPMCTVTSWLQIADYLVTNNLPPASI